MIWFVTAWAVLATAYSVFLIVAVHRLHQQVVRLASTHPAAPAALLTKGDRPDPTDGLTAEEIDRRRASLPYGM